MMCELCWDTKGCKDSQARTFVLCTYQEGETQGHTNGGGHLLWHTGGGSACAYCLVGVQVCSQPVALF
jgi:hypothetical protein